MPVNIAVPFTRAQNLIVLFWFEVGGDKQVAPGSLERWDNVGRVTPWKKNAYMVIWHSRPNI